MELSQLEYFKITARHNSFTQAAEALHITQPALSKSISKLEKELGAALFDRGSGPLQLSSAGRSFLVWCNQALAAIDSGVREVRDISGTGGGEVRVAVSEAIFIKHLIRDFLATHQNAGFHCHLLTHDQMRTAIYEGAVDFVISRGPIYGADILWRPVYNDTLAVLMPTKHRLAKRSGLRLEDLADEYFVMGDLNYDMKSYVYRLCYDAGFTPKVRYEGHESDVASMLDTLEDTVMLVFSSTTFGVAADQEKNPGVIAIPIVIPIIDSPDSEMVGLGFRSNRYQSAAVLEFYEMVESYYSTLPSGMPL